MTEYENKIIKKSVELLKVSGENTKLQVLGLLEGLIKEK